MKREFDVVLFGATGYTGQLTARYLAERGPTGLRWAMAGRSKEKLASVGIDVPLLVADSGDPDSLAELVGRTRVVVTTVGPYLEVGEALVKAAAEAGTDYVDITGEPEFVDLMYVRYHDVAVQTGARLVHACGFDSAPHDIGAFYTAQQLAASGAVETKGIVRSSGGVSGGTFASALGQFARLRTMRATARQRRSAEGRFARAHHKLGGIQRNRELGVWMLPLPTIDPEIVVRSAEALPLYGSSFTYGHYAGVRRTLTVALTVVGIPFILLVAQIGPARRWLASKLPQGTGPSDDVRAKAAFTVDYFATGDGRSIHTRITGPDPYDVTAAFAAETALSLLFDDNPPTSGQVTTAAAAGEALLARMEKAGMTFEVTP